MGASRGEKSSQALAKLHASGDMSGLHKENRLLTISNLHDMANINSDPVCMDMQVLLNVDT